MYLQVRVNNKHPEDGNERRGAGDGRRRSSADTGLGKWSQLALKSMEHLNDFPILGNTSVFLSHVMTKVWHTK